MRHVTIFPCDDGMTLACENCGDQHSMCDPNTEQPLWLQVAIESAFLEAHKDCRPIDNQGPPCVSATHYKLTPS